MKIQCQLLILEYIWLKLIIYVLISQYLKKLSWTSVQKSKKMETIHAQFSLKKKKSDINNQTRLV